MTKCRKNCPQLSIEARPTATMRQTPPLSSATKNRSWWRHGNTEPTATATCSSAQPRVKSWRGPHVGWTPIRDPIPFPPPRFPLFLHPCFINCLREYWTILNTHCTSYFHHNLQHHRTVTSDIAPMTDNCINTKDTWVTVILW